MDRRRPVKRVRPDEFFFDGESNHTGSFLKVKLLSDVSFKSKGWPWIQLGIRGILGAEERLAKASILSDGGLLMRTKTEAQTSKLLNVHTFAGEECQVSRDERLNSSRGIVRAHDLIELSEEEVVGWLKEFGVTKVKRFTRKVNGRTEKTATLLLTFDAPTCPSRISLDYVTYKIEQYIPNPMMCYKCGKFGHSETFCKADSVCLECGEPTHEGGCTPKCINCGKSGHSHSCLQEKNPE